MTTLIRGRSETPEHRQKARAGAASSGQAPPSNKSRRAASRPAWLGTTRYRLTAWYVACLTGILAILGTATYISVDAQLLRDARAKLVIASNEIIGQLALALPSAAPAQAANADVDGLLASIVLHAPRSIASAPSTRADVIYIRLVDPRTGATVAASPTLRNSPALLASFPRPRIGERLPMFVTAGPTEETMMGIMTTAVPDSPDLLQTSVNWDSSEDFLTDLTIAICCVCLLLILLSAAGCWLLVGRALAPIEEIVTEAETLSLEKSEPPRMIPRSQADAELRHLVSALNDLLDRLHRSALVQRQFTADASHELRTPLAILRGEIDLSLTRPRTAPEYERVLRSCLEETERMIAIVGDLSLLTRQDNPPKAQLTERSPVDLGALCEEVASSFRLLAQGRGQEILVRREGAPCVLPAGNASSLRRAIGNLLSNAIAHSDSSGRIIVTTCCGESAVAVDVADSGVGISEEDLPHIFERFYRADKSRSEGDGTGLGLSIVKGVAEAHGGSVAAVSKPGQGTTVTLVFPTN